MINLSNKNILITGASSGIGRETAILASKLGATLFISGKNKERLNETFQLLEGKGHKQSATDLSKEANIYGLVEMAPVVDGIVPCAGIVKPFPVKFIQPKHIHEIFQINYYSVVLLTAALIKSKKIAPKASFVFMSSVSSNHPYIGGALYVSSKAAIEAYCKTLALELSPQKIRANIVSPGLVKTSIFFETEAASSKEELEKYEKNYPLGFGEPEDVANMIAFLLSDAAKWITGQIFIMDGGLLLGAK